LVEKQNLKLTKMIFFCSRLPTIKKLLVLAAVVETLYLLSVYVPKYVAGPRHIQAVYNAPRNAQELVQLNSTPTISSTDGSLQKYLEVCTIWDDL
jgi:hypothetical protein